MNNTITFRLTESEPTPLPRGWGTDVGRLAQAEDAHVRMRQHVWQSDQKRHGVRDLWTFDYRGDCEDRALAAMRTLAWMGWPLGAMRLYTGGRKGRDGKIGAHAIAVIRFTRTNGVDDMILDNERFVTLWRSEAVGYLTMRPAAELVAEVHAARAEPAHG